MSEVKDKLETAERTPLTVEIEPMEFKADFEGRFMTSIQLCKLASDFFRSVFSDFDGTKLEVGNGGEVTIALYFKHCAHNDDEIYAVDRGSAETTGAKVIDKMRRNDLQMKSGDRYEPTKDGKDVIMPLLIPRLFNHGKPNWGNFTSDIVEQGYYYQAPLQLTKIAGIDPRKMLGKLYGDKEELEDGTTGYIDYSANIASILPNANPQNPVYVLDIKRAHNTNITNTAQSFGFGTNNGIVH